MPYNLILILFLYLILYLFLYLHGIDSVSIPYLNKRGKFMLKMMPIALILMLLCGCATAPKYPDLRENLAKCQEFQAGQSNAIKDLRQQLEDMINNPRFPEVIHDCK